MKKYAVIVAGGTGTRMGSDVPKQFIMLNDKPVLYYTIRTFLKSYDDLQVILVIPANHKEKSERIKEFFDKNRIHFVEGGETRFHSVKNGLSLVKEESIIFVHDGVRCLVTIDLIHRCYETAFDKGSAIPVIPCKDSVRLQNGDANESLNRTNVMLVQTPQTFKSNVLLPAFNTGYNEKFTDEATVVEASGQKVGLVEGEETNIKITRPIDLLIAEKILETRPQSFSHFK